MMTLNEAIQKRLEEQRLAREEAERKHQEHEARIAQYTQRVAEKTRTILEKEKGFSLEGFEIQAYLTGSKDHYHICIRLPGDTSNHISPVSWIYEPNIETQLKFIHWEAVHYYDDGDISRYNNISDFLDAIIFAQYGTIEPEVSNV